MSTSPRGGGGGVSSSGRRSSNRNSNTSPSNIDNGIEYNGELVVEDIKSLISRTSNKKSSYKHDTFSSSGRNSVSTPRNAKRSHDSRSSSTRKHQHHHHHHQNSPSNSPSTGRKKTKSNIPHEKENIEKDSLKSTMGRMSSSSDSDNRKFLDRDGRKGKSTLSFPDYFIDVPSSPDSTSSTKKTHDFYTNKCPSLHSIGYPGIYSMEETSPGAIEVFSRVANVNQRTQYDTLSTLSSSLESSSDFNNNMSNKHMNRRGSDGDGRSHRHQRNVIDGNSKKKTKATKSKESSSSTPIRGNSPSKSGKSITRWRDLQEEEEEADYHHHKNETKEPTSGDESIEKRNRMTLNRYSSSMSTAESVMSNFENVFLNSCCSSSSQEDVQDGTTSTSTPYSLPSTQQLLRRSKNVLAKAAEILVEDGTTTDSFAKRFENSISVFGNSEHQGTQQGRGDSLSSTSKTVQCSSEEYSMSLFPGDGRDPEKGSNDNQQHRNRHTTTTSSQSQRQILKRLKLSLVDRVRRQLQSSGRNDSDETSTDDSNIGNKEKKKKDNDKDEPKEGIFGYSLYATVTICLIFVLIIGSVIAVTVLSLTSSEPNTTTMMTPEQDDVTLPTDLPPPSQQPHPTVSALSPRMESLVSLVGSMVSNTPNSTFHDPWSPQFRAMAWLADEDPASMPIEEETKFLLIERYAIMVLYFQNGIDAPILQEKYHFKTDLHICSWNDLELAEGISCFGQYVSEIVLPDSNLQSKLPSELGLLKRLQNVVLDDNFLSGTLPKQMFGLPELQILQISNNRLQGPIGFIEGLPRIRHIDLSNNRLSGSLPIIGSFLPPLEVLNLKGNLFHSNIPEEYGNMQSLIGLDLSKNHLTSTLPSELGSMVNLSTLYLHENNFWGTIPEEFEFLVNLKRFTFHDTRIDGDVDPILCAVDYLSFDKLTANCLGSDPQVICTCCTRCCSSGGCGVHPWDRE